MIAYGFSQLFLGKLYDKIGMLKGSMAKELGPKGIRVNALAPGTIATSFHDRFNTPENRERMKGIYPLRREGDAEDIADLVLFLASADSDYLTGTNIDINGGMSFS
ncbi:MAG: SDR family oxidoreductase [Paludibacter sp.]|nr:SDR family oxidoreductase [Paludibacter sp.]